MTDRTVFFCEPLRTPIGKFGGAFRHTPATALGAAAISGVLERGDLDPESVDAVIMGHVIQAGAKMNTARQAAIHGGVPENAPAMTVNRVCGSGAQAVASAAQEIWLGCGDCIIAGGMENMDQGPYLLDKARWGYRMGASEIYDATLRDGLLDAFSGEHSGRHTEDLAEKYEISREEQDRWAFRSQKRFADAQQEGKFDGEIVPVDVKAKSGAESIDRDESNRPGVTMENLQKLKPAFGEKGTITAGNAPGLNSAAAAMILAEESAAARLGLQPVARLVSYGLGALEPGMFGLGPIPAVRQALDRAGWDIGEVERFEINEAFAAIAIAVMRELKISEGIVNVEGGAVAHGHPIGATGAVLTTRLLHSMTRDRLKRGVVTLCIGGGQGIALALERSA